MRVMLIVDIIKFLLSHSDDRLMQRRLYCIFFI